MLGGVVDSSIRCLKIPKGWCQGITPGMRIWVDNMLYEAYNVTSNCCDGKYVTPSIFEKITKIWAILRGHYGKIL